MRKIIHVDMDAFFAAVEQRDEPTYRGRPVVVGGLPERRGVVAAASYEARKFGIHSAMSSRVAAQRCRHLVFVRPRFEVYRQISQQIRAIFRRYTDLVEPLALDEAYLDVTENKRCMPSATLMAREIKQQIFRETGLTASAGISINKFLAKIASGLDKPDGLCLIPPEKAEEFLETLPIEKFHGIGKVTAAKMKMLGIHLGLDLKARSQDYLVQHFGKYGFFYYKIVRAQDERPVKPNRIRKSIGTETTFVEDLADLAIVQSALEKLVAEVEQRLKHYKTRGRTITLKLKYANFQQVTRSRTLAQATDRRTTLLEVAQSLLKATAAGKRKIRLLGLSMSNLVTAKATIEYQQLSLPFYQDWIGYEEI